MKRIVIHGDDKSGYSVDLMHADVVDYRFNIKDRKDAQTVGYTLYEKASGFLRLYDYTNC